MAIQKITAAVLGNNAVTAASVAAGTLSAADIADNSITAAKISASTSPTFGGLTVDGTGTAQITSTAASTLELIRSGTAGQISSLIMKDGGNVQNRINSSGGALEFEYGASNINAIKIDNNGDISFYEDTGTTAKFFWDASAESLGIGTTSPANLLHVKGASAGALDLARFRLEGATNNPMLKIEADEANATAGIDVSGSVATELTFSQGGTERMRIGSTGVIRVGTISGQTNAKLTVRQNTNDIEFGHGNVTSGYYGTLGASYTNGLPFLALSAEADSSGNTFTTRGIKGNIIQNAADGSLTFSQATTASASGQTPAERVRIDSSGNLLVGKTSSGLANAGIEFTASNILRTTKASLASAEFNRTGTDGDIAIFWKDTLPIGSIGSYAGAEVYITGGTTNTSGVVIGDRLFVPCTTSGAGEDGLTDLGSSGRRWKDLYLSGNINASSTGSLHSQITSSGGDAKLSLVSSDSHDAWINYSGATNEMSAGYDRGNSTFNFCNSDTIASNIRVSIRSAGGITFNGDTAEANALDDYEEGTWTPVLKDDTASTTYSHAVGRYIKIGTMVQAWFHVDVGNYDAAAASNTLGIEGLPFTSSNTTANDYGSVSGLHCNNWASSSKPDNALISQNTNYANFYKSQGQTGIEGITHNNMQGGNLLGCFHYRSA